MSDEKPVTDETVGSEISAGKTNGALHTNGSTEALPDEDAPANVIALGGGAEEDAADAEADAGRETGSEAEASAPEASEVSEPDDSGTPENEAEPEPERGSGGVIEKAVLVVASAAISGTVVALLMMRFGDIAPGADADLGARVAAVETKLDGAAAVAGDPEAIANLGNRFAKIEDRIGAIEARPATAAGSGAPIAEGAGLERVNARFDSLAGELEKRNAQLEGRLSVLESTTPADLPEVLRGLVTTDNFAALEERVAFLESNDVAQDARRAALAVALANLVRASSGSGAFANELEGLQILLPGDAAVADIQNIAGEGVATEQMLVAGFDDLARDALHAEARVTDEGWMIALWRNLTAQFTVRPSGEQEGESTGAVLSRMEARLGEGNLREAVAEGQALQGPAAEAAVPWLRDAETRVKLDALISDVNARVLQDLSE